MSPERIHFHTGVCACVCARFLTSYASNDVPRIIRRTEWKEKMACKMPGDNNSPGGQAGWLDEGLLVTASSDLAVRY